MKIKNQTWIVLVIFALMIGAVYYLNNQKKIDAAEITPTSDISFVFTATDGIPSSIEIKPATGETVKVARDAQNVWALKLPIEAEADQSAAEAAASQISALQVISKVDADPAVFGFDAPTFVIIIEFADGTPALAGGARETHTLEIGDSTPTNSGYYVRLDKGKMMIVDLYGIDSLLQLAAFPPYLNTPTPSPLPPTETPVSPTEAVSTPDLSVTPTP